MSDNICLSAFLSYSFSAAVLACNAPQDFPLRAKRPVDTSDWAFRREKGEKNVKRIPALLAQKSTMGDYSTKFLAYLSEMYWSSVDIRTGWGLSVSLIGLPCGVFILAVQIYSQPPIYYVYSPSPAPLTFCVISGCVPLRFHLRLWQAHHPRHEHKVVLD